MGKSVFRVFWIELGMWKVGNLQQKFSSLLVFMEETQEKNTQKTQHLWQITGDGLQQVSNCAFLRYGRACGTASLHGLVRWSG